MKRLMIMAGGTGGHVYPALAVADLLSQRQVEIVWLGTRNGLEARAVPAAGYPIEWINVKGLRGKGLSGWLLSPYLILRASTEAFLIIRRRRPDALLGMGGFVSGPGGLVATLLRLPLMVHEQNAIAGLTNRWLSKLAERVFTGFPGVLRRAEHLGNPLRQGFIDHAASADAVIGNRRVRLLVVGGSQGARALNEVVPGAVAAVPAELRPQVRHQTGRGSGEIVESAYRAVGVDAQTDEFIDDMASAYRWADLVVCRAGAMTVAEVCAAGVAALFVPFPFAVGDHQTANARYLADQSAAVVMQQDDFDEHVLGDELRELVEAPEKIETMRGCLSGGDACVIASGISILLELAASV